MSTSPTALPAAPCRSLSFSWRQSKQRRQRNDRLQNNWATGTRCSVSLQPIMITRGQAECPSSGGQMGVVDPAQGLAYSYSGKNVHILQTEGPLCRCHVASPPRRPTVHSAGSLGGAARNSSRWKKWEVRRDHKLLHEWQPRNVSWWHFSRDGGQEKRIAA